MIYYTEKYAIAYDNLVSGGRVFCVCFSLHFFQHSRATRSQSAVSVIFCARVFSMKMRERVFGALLKASSPSIYIDSRYVQRSRRMVVLSKIRILSKFYRILPFSVRCARAQPAYPPPSPTTFLLVPFIYPPISFAHSNDSIANPLADAIVACIAQKRSPQ